MGAGTRDFMVTMKTHSVSPAQGLASFRLPAVASSATCPYPQERASGLGNHAGDSEGRCMGQSTAASPPGSQSTRDCSIEGGCL